MSQYISIPNEHFDNFPKWVIYIFPLFRLGDFLIGCCAGIIYIKRGLIVNKFTASLCELTTFLLILISEYIFVHQIGVMGTEWFRYTMLFTPTSVSLVFLFAVNQGIISRLLTCQPMLYLGNISAYTFLIHQMVIRYLDVIINKLFGISLNSYIKVFIALAITIACAEIFKKFELFYKEKSLYQS